MTKKSEVLTARQQYWLEQLQSCEGSGKTVADYAAEHGLNARTMYSAKKALVKTQPGRFQRAQVIDAVVTLTGQQLNWLLDGYDVMRLRPHERPHFSSVL